MQNKEIEDIKDSLRLLHKILWNEHREGIYTIQRTLEYINQLETDKQKLIEKLEKVREDMKQDQYTEMYYLQDIEEILKILKGENDE